SHLHHLCNPATCQAYLHALRWQERPLPWPRCQSHHVAPWGTYPYQPGLRRDRGQEQACKHTCHALTGTLLDGSKHTFASWLLAPFRLCLACASRRLARAVGVHVRPSSRWCWWRRHAALSSARHRQREGTVEADDL